MLCVEVAANDGEGVERGRRKGRKGILREGVCRMEKGGRPGDLGGLRSFVVVVVVDGRFLLFGVYMCVCSSSFRTRG